MLIVVGLAIAGALLNYSPIPFWDVWTGYVDFIAQINHGDYSRWWSGHNEHRIVLSRLLFWLDANWLGADFKFLIVFNYLLLFAIVATFWRMARELSPPVPLWLQFFCVMWLCSWIQHDNLTWGFQSQFFLAQLLPLLSFYTLHLSRHGDVGYFYGAVALGVLSLGTMANGVLALPLMVCFALLARLPKYQVMILSIVSVLGISAYFYQLPNHGGSSVNVFLEQPWEVIQYALLYLGGPFYTFFGKGEVARWLATAIAAAMVAGCAVIFFKNWRVFSQKTLTLALLFFILYIGGSALATALGRVNLGMEQAASSRYMTPVLMLWVTFFLLLWLQPNGRVWLVSKTAKALFLVFALALLVVQTKALDIKPTDEKDKRLAVLALTVGANDPSVIHRIHWASTQALALIQPAKKQQIAIFSLPPYRDVLDKMGQRLTLDDLPTCQGYVDYVKSLDTHFLRIEGWAAITANADDYRVGYILDEDARVSGAVLGGDERLDVAKAIGESAKYSGFRGYVSRVLQGQTITLFFPDAHCILQHTITPPLYQRTVVNTANLPKTANLTQVTQPHDWKGSDYHHSQLPKMTVLGSYINADSDMGKIRLSLKRGDKLLYRSGPDTRRQTLRIADSQEKHTLLPAKQWVALHFDSPNLPETFDVILADEGDGWGEWSAIAVSNE